MKLLDYIYYISYNYYKRNGEDEPILPASVVTSLVPLFNISCIYFIYGYIYDFEFINKWQTLFISLPMMAFTFYRYKKITNYKSIAIRISEYSEKKRNTIHILILIYMIISFILCIGLAIYIGEIRNPPPFWDGWFK